MLTIIGRSIVRKPCLGLQTYNHYGLRSKSKSAQSTRLQNVKDPSRMRIAVHGCGHGELNEIYASVEKACEVKGWNSVDLLIIGGDFQVGTSLLMLKPDGPPVLLLFLVNE